MADSSKFDFCSKCGALARDGVCQSCGYQLPGFTNQNQDTNVQDTSQLQGTNVHQQDPSTQTQMQNTYSPLPMQNNGQFYPQYLYSMPPEIKKEGSNKTAIIFSIVIGSVFLILFVLIFLVVVTPYLNNRIMGYSNTMGSEKEYEDDYEKEESGSKEAEAAFTHYTMDTTSDNLNEEGQDMESPYYSGPYNAIANDLSYQMGFTTDKHFVKKNPNMSIEIEYPQIVSGDIPGRTYINNTLYYEYTYYEDLLKEYMVELTSEDDVFECSSDAYITYMDEKYLSVVFIENLYIYDESEYFSNISFYCLNFDIENGTILDNTQLLNMDEAFAMDFRMREEMENGEYSLTGYTDQEIQNMLNNPETLVIFFTPMGMEVGLNLGDSVVYVTYEDYLSYTNTN